MALVPQLLPDNAHTTETYIYMHMQTSHERNIGMYVAQPLRREPKRREPKHVRAKLECNTGWLCLQL